MIKIAAIDHLVLRTSHPNKMINFYCQVLGCHVERALAEKTGLTQLRAGNALIDIVSVESQLGRLGGGPPTREGNNIDHFCLQIIPNSEKKIQQHLSAFGVDVPPFVERYGAQGFARSIYIQDPDGNTIELIPQKSI